MKCPLGYDLEAGVCARAPCMECMRKLGEEIVADMQGRSQNRDPLEVAMEKAETHMAHCFLNEAQRKKFYDWVPPSQWTLKAILETLAEQKLKNENVQ